MNIKVSEVVGQYLDLANLGKAEFAKAYRIALRGWRQLNWDIVGTVKRIQVDISQDNTISLPDDFISEINFGESNGNGGIRSYTKVNNFNNETYRDDLVNPVGNGSYNNWNNNAYFQGSLGVGSYTDLGFYQINKAEHKIVLDSSYTTQSYLVLEYLSYTGEDCDDYVINELAQEALLSWIDWQFSKGDRRMGLAEKRDKERSWYKEKSDAKLRIKKLTVADMNNAARRSVKLGLKS